MQSNTDLEFKRDTLLDVVARMQTIMVDLHIATPYHKETKIRINEIAESLSEEFKDYRRAILRDSKKADLVVNIHKVCKRTIEHCMTALEGLEKEFKQKEDAKHKAELRAERQKIVDRMAPAYKEYVACHGHRAVGMWYNIIELVLDGYITENELIDYGVNI